jgi:N-acetylglucosaminyldiphosphoundecaprenol N-acetyl-beta-D-mannosaminyltransferase
MKIHNVRYNNLTVPEALESVLELVDCQKKANIFFLNANCLNKARNDKEYKSVLDFADLVLSDGLGLKILSRLFGEPMKDNCNGTDLSPLILEEAARRKLKIFFLGGKDGIARQAAQNVQKKYPDILMVGTHSGYFSDDKAVIDQINRSGADILFVAMGVPLQEKWIAKNRALLNPSICLGVGALLDYLSGTLPRAPLWMRRMHMEWVWRIFVDPRRMVKRYLLEGISFIIYSVFYVYCIKLQKLPLLSESLFLNWTRLNLIKASRVKILFVLPARIGGFIIRIRTCI